MVKFIKIKDFCPICKTEIKRISYDILLDNTTIEDICPSCIRKTTADWRMGNLDPSSSVGRGFIGQQIVANTYGVEDCNLMMDNFHFYIDLSKILGYGYVEVKIASLIYISWYFSRIKSENFDTIFLLCMDMNWPWKDVYRVYAIPWKAVGNRKSMGITKNPSKDKLWYEKFRIDVEPFNDTYHSMKLSNCTVLRKHQL